MPSKNAHLGQAEHNAALYAALDHGKYSDWAATLLFYECLQYVDAFLATQLPSPHGMHPGKHEERDNAVNKIKELRPIYNDYRSLKDGSRNARYNPPTRYSAAQLAEFESDRERIKDALRPHIPGM
jgi:hypothetical protein